MFENFLKYMDNLNNKIEQYSNRPEPIKRSSWKNIINTIFKPYDIIIFNIANFLCIGGLYTIVMMLFQHVTSYFIKQQDSDILYASYIVALIITYLFVSIFVSMKWYNTVFLKEKLLQYSFNKKIFLKTVTFSIISILLMFLPILVAIILLKRVPNPNWRIELSVFTFYFLIVALPFWAFKFSVYLAFILRGETLPNMKEICNIMSGRTKFVFLSFLLLLYVVTLFLKGILHSDESLITEFTCHWGFFIMCIGCVNIAEIQRQEYFINQQDK